MFSEVVGRLKGSQAPSANGDVAPKSTPPSGKKWHDCIDKTVSSCHFERVLRCGMVDVKEGSRARNFRVGRRKVGGDVGVEKERETYS